MTCVNQETGAVGITLLSIPYTVVIEFELINI